MTKELKFRQFSQFKFKSFKMRQVKARSIRAISFRQPRIVKTIIRFSNWLSGPPSQDYQPKQEPRGIGTVLGNMWQALSQNSQNSRFTWTFSDPTHISATVESYLIEAELSPDIKALEYLGITMTFDIAGGEVCVWDFRKKSKVWVLSILPDAEKTKLTDLADEATQDIKQNILVK